MAKTPRGSWSIIFKNNPAAAGPSKDFVPVGSKRFEQARQRLAKLAGYEPEQVHDADVQEYLRRGETETRDYLEQQQTRR